jgi:hypothetical protein
MYVQPAPKRAVFFGVYEQVLPLSARRCNQGRGRLRSRIELRSAGQHQQKMDVVGRAPDRMDVNLKIAGDFAGYVPSRSG